MSMLSKSVVAALAMLTSVVAMGQQPAPQTAVDMRFCGMKPGKPPLKYLWFDLTLRNPTDKPQWYLFPASLYEKPQEGPKDAGIDAIELSSESPERKVIVVDFLGTMKLQPEGAGGFKGVLLPGGAVVSIHGFGIDFWGEPRSPISVRVVMGDRVTIGGAPVEKWVGKHLLSAKTTDVKDLAIVGSKEAHGLKELPVEIAKSGEVEIADALSRSCR